MRDKPATSMACAMRTGKRRRDQLAMRGIAPSNHCLGTKLYAVNIVSGDAYFEWTQLEKTGACKRRAAGP